MILKDLWHFIQLVKERLILILNILNYKKIELDIKNIIDEKYIIKSACGQGNLAVVPWICIFDSSITKKAEQGIYILLFYLNEI